MAQKLKKGNLFVTGRRLDVDEKMNNKMDKKK